MRPEDGVVFLVFLGGFFPLLPSPCVCVDVVPYMDGDGR